MTDQQGPMQLSYNETVCGECEYLHRRVDRYGTFSNDYTYSCKHPIILEESMAGGALPPHARRIGTTDRTPDFCPFLKK